MGEHICKAVDTAAVTEQQMERINRYTRRKLTAEEVFVFTVVLCDNEIDRDCERFPVESLEVLGQLFLGKTGVFDHTPKAENQSARVFDTALEQTDEVNSLGEPYCMLKAWAYMVRCEKNADLILEIDAGIKKEVSVGCAVEEMICSVCGANRKEGACAHEKGQVYDGRVCHHLLVNPTDAYEWSFVAVPAQKKAGVVKRTGAALAKGEVTVSKVRLAHLEKLAKAGGRYEKQVRKDVVRLGLLGQPDLEAEVLEGIAARLDLPQLEALRKCFGSAAEKHYPVSPQLARPQTEAGEESTQEFRI